MARSPKPLEPATEEVKKVVAAEPVDVAQKSEEPAVKLVKVRAVGRDMRDPFQNRWFSQVPQETPLTAWVQAQIDAELLKVV